MNKNHPNLPHFDFFRFIILLFEFVKNRSVIIFFCFFLFHYFIRTFNLASFEYFFLFVSLFFYLLHKIRAKQNNFFSKHTIFISEVTQLFPLNVLFSTRVHLKRNSGGKKSSFFLSFKLSSLHTFKTKKKRVQDAVAYKFT